jgi:hypothetical protein
MRAFHGLPHTADVPPNPPFPLSQAPLLGADGRHAQAQNETRSAAMVFGNDDDGGGAAENVEMTDFAVVCC